MARPRPARYLNVLVLLALVLSFTVLLGACASPAQNQQQNQQQNPQQAITPTPATPATPATPITRPAPVSDGSVVKLDLSCQRDSDCVVKDVGNCCGAFPSCVNANSPTDPAAVKAQCAKQGRMSVCGFKPVSGCQCVKGQCANQVQMVE